jgi:hypothetical protein
MVGLDALIGHGDRHWSNYGIIVSAKNGNIAAKFSPVYDTASGYLTEINDTARLETMLSTDLQNDNWYQPKNIQGLCKITVPDNIKSNHFKLIARVLSQPQLSAYKEDIAKPFRLYNRKLAKKILATFLPGISQLRNNVICTILEKRHRLGCQVLGI